jgi:2-amino-4-hydroxy-6-hydroxymethyldihydropteridine diphosphokinase
MATAIFSLGSNLGDRIKNLEEAIRLMGKQMGGDQKSSMIYQSIPWGYDSKQNYYNCCLLIHTSIPPLELLDLALEVEIDMGRMREGAGYADRVIDIDLILYDDLVVNHPRLVIPHPRMSERKFVLVPLAELSPDHIHPVSGLSISELLDRCSDTSPVSPV